MSRFDDYHEMVTHIDREHAVEMHRIDLLRRIRNVLIGTALALLIALAWAALRPLPDTATSQPDRPAVGVVTCPTATNSTGGYQPHPASAYSQEAC
jgi:hypothetical protein